MFEQWLRQEASAMGHSQREIARLLAANGHPIHHTTVNKWFTGERNPSRRHLAALFHILGITDPVEIVRVQALVEAA